MVLAGLGWLASADAGVDAGAVQAECLRGLERALSVHAAARARVLAAFTAQGGYEDDGQGSPRTWLTWQTKVTRPAASARARRRCGPSATIRRSPTRWPAGDLGVVGQADRGLDRPAARGAAAATRT